MFIRAPKKAAIPVSAPKMSPMPIAISPKVTRTANQPWWWPLSRLTPEAMAHGMALALPQVVVARPTGVGRAITTYTIPIEGRDEWLAAARAAEKPA